MNLLIIGGSGGLSGCLAQKAMKEGHKVWAVTRGKRPLAKGIHGIRADRNHEEELQEALQTAAVHWDCVFDCICMTAANAAADLRILPEFSSRLVVISTDSVYDPKKKQVPQNEETEFYVTGDDYAGNKRKMEEVFLEHKNSELRWTIFRPGHIYGPGFLLGCFPEHSRQANLLETIRKDQPLRLVGGGRLLTQPVFVEDLVYSMLDCIDKEKTYHEIFCIGGPKAVPNREYYELLGELTGHVVTITMIPEEGYAEAHPEYSGHLCERSYSLEKLRNAGICLPNTPLREGLARQIEWLDKMTQQTIELRPLSDEYLPMIEVWLNKSHVKRWYEIPELGVTIDDWISEISQYKGAFSWISYCIILSNNRPIGMCLYYKAEDSKEEDFGILPLKGTYAIDYFIGEENELRKGLGKGTIALLTDTILSFCDAERVTAETDMNNIVSQKTLLSCGFTRLCEEKSRFVRYKNQ